MMRYRCKFSEPNKVLWDLVRPEDEDWQYNFTTMGDFDMIFRRLTSVPNWKQDRQIVYLFKILLGRKHQYFSQSYFEEDAVLVPSLYPPSIPNAQDLSQQQRNLFLMVEYLENSTYAMYVKAAYDDIYQQFNAIENWEKNQFLVNLHQRLKTRESSRIRPKDPQIEAEQNERIKIKAEKWVNENKERIEDYAYDRYSISEVCLKHRITEIRGIKNWRHNKTLWTWNNLLAIKLRKMQMKQKGTSWKSRIVHEQSESSKGLLQRMWEKIWASKKPEKPASEN